MKQHHLAIFLLLSASGSYGIRVNDIVFHNDEEPFLHNYRHASALEKALTTATDEEKEQLEQERESQKEYKGDWNHIEGPDDSDTPMYYRSQAIDKIFKS